jgi:signal transduction histidine kinase
VKQLERVLRHLVADARDALPSGGRLTIATRLALRSDGHDVVLSITDSRSRMTDDPATSVFEPTISTKKTARGAGLNRAAVYGIVLQMGGQITVDSSPAGGLTFTIRLPVNDG